MPLSDIEIRKAKPSKKPLRIFDGGGLYLEVSPSGGKWWRVKYRFNGKKKRLSVGVYPDVGLKFARERLEETRKLLAGVWILEKTEGQFGKQRPILLRIVFKSS